MIVPTSLFAIIAFVTIAEAARDVSIGKHIRPSEFAPSLLFFDQGINTPSIKIFSRSLKLSQSCAFLLPRRGNCQQRNKLQNKQEHNNLFLPSKLPFPPTHHEPQDNHSHRTRRIASPLYGIKGFRSWFETVFPTAIITLNHSNKFINNNNAHQRNSPAQNKKRVNQTNNQSKIKNGNTKGAGGDGFQPEIFDHVLIDANQFLHSTLRKSYNKNVKQAKRSTYQQSNNDFTITGDEFLSNVTDHSLSLLLRELNTLTSTIAIPRKSLVIALDGSPGAAKLDMQRRRRFGVYKKAESQMRQLEILRERGWRDVDIGFFGDGKALNANTGRGGAGSQQRQQNQQQQQPKSENNPLLSKHDREQITLNITPGTAYMDRVTNALLYWAWKCVSNPFWPKFDNKNGHHVTNQHGMSRGQVKIYINPSYVPGEGEIKLLDWIMRGHDSHFSKGHRPSILPGESVAILGGDSDLVLMGLVVPPEVTHNIHIILPGERQKSLVVSIWETTRMLARMIEGTASYGGGKKSINKLNGKKSNKSPLSLGETKRARLDMVLLVLLNGNDYLPRIRGCGGGFDVFFHVYLHVVKRWKNRVKHGDDAIDEMHPFLINIDDNNELSINVPFALTFFRQLLNHSQDPADFEEPNEDSSPYQSNLGVLNNLIEAKFLPGPMDFQVLNPTSNTQLSMVDNFESELWQMNSELSQNTSTIMDEVFGDGGVEIVRMTLGHFPEDVYASHVSGSSNSDIDTDSHEVVTTLLGASDGHGVISRMIQKEGGRSYLFEVPHRIGNSIKHAKRRLACLAVEEIFGKENMDELFGYDSSDMNEGRENDGSSFKSRAFAQANATSYLGGLMWNLETYQHGCSADYGYNYGIRSSPTPFEIVSLLENVNEQGKLKLYRQDLIDNTKTIPLSDGLSCLAALPPQAWHLVPEPYSWLADESFDNLYSSCMDPETNVFDALSFERKCQGQIDQIASQRKAGNVEPANQERDESDQSNRNERRIYAGSKFWTVISHSYDPLNHPFAPPEPYAERVTRLRRSRRIMASKIPVTPGRHFRQNLPNINDDTSRYDGSKGEASNSSALAEGGKSAGRDTGDLDDQLSIHDISYKSAFEHYTRKN